MYVGDFDFSIIYNTCEHYAFQEFYKHDGLLLKDDKLCVPNCSLRELLVCEAHVGDSWDIL